MSLFSKEKGIILSILNAVFLIWILVALITIISNLTSLVIKDHTYSYEEYERIYCDFEYETEEDCKNNYKIYELESNYIELDIDSKRSILISGTNVILVTTALVLLNINKKTNKKKTD